jgi:hypothetical protein
MTTEQTPSEAGHHTAHQMQRGGGSSGPVYGLGMIGACVFYLKRATTNEERVKGFLKALVWPAFLVYELLTFLKKD